MSDPKAAPGHWQECDICGEEVPEPKQVTHPAYSEVFCSVACKNRFLNRVSQNVR